MPFNRSRSAQGKPNSARGFAARFYNRSEFIAEPTLIPPDPDFGVIAFSLDAEFKCEMQRILEIDPGPFECDDGISFGLVAVMS
jgi:hypothetical protein